MAKVEQIGYGGWTKCRQISNGKIELIITEEVGPRIIRLGFTGQDNLFCEVKESMGNIGGETWHLYGGHRLWHAPEHSVRTYFPDNNPVDIQLVDDFVRVTQSVEDTTGMQKEIDIYMSDNRNHVKLVHRLKNHNLWDVEFAPWALSVMTTGGTAIIPHPPRGSHPDALLPCNSLALWPYTNMSDPRWTWGAKYILLRQDTETPAPQKVGISVSEGWAAYVVNNTAFIKLFGYDANAEYPDMGSNVETFTNDFMLELETLGPTVKLRSNETVEHTEDWYLFENVKAPKNDKDVQSDILPLVQSIKP